MSITSTPPASVPIAALIQMTSGIDPAANLATIDRAMADAAAGGAVMAFLPEMSLLLDRDRARSAEHIVREADSAWPTALQEMAQKEGIWLHSGSMPLLSDDGERRVNRSHVIAPDGSIRARYDKIHMFDVTLPTGEAHWHMLMRARAIETGCHVLAAAQCGDHDDGRATYGHSLIVDPWGGVLADAGAACNGTGYRVVLAPIDGAATERARQAIPLNRSRAMRNISL